MRSPRFRGWIKAERRRLYHQGEFLPQAMQGERVVREDILQAVRNEGHADLQQVVSVMLETDGILSIITGHANGPTSR